jgi:hypothetical protein
MRRREGRKVWERTLRAAVMQTPSFVAVVAAAATGVVLAGAAAADVERQTSHGTPYITGGVGSEEQEAMRAMGDGYRLRLIFAVASSFDYLADVTVTIKDRKGRTRLEALSTGPFLYADLPPGGYEVTAVRASGRTVRASVSVPARGSADEWLFWPPEP